MPSVNRHLLKMVIQMEESRLTEALIGNFVNAIVHIIFIKEMGTMFPQPNAHKLGVMAYVSVLWSNVYLGQTGTRMYCARFVQKYNWAKQSVFTIVHSAFIYNSLVCSRKLL